MPTLGADGHASAHLADGSEAGARLWAVLDAAVDAIITIDDNGIIDAVNPATESMFGYDSAEMLGNNVSMLMPDSHRHAHDGYMRHYLDTGERRIIGIGREVEGRRKDGSLFPCDLAVSEFFLKGRRMFTGILRDVTDRRQAQRAAQQRLEDLAHAGRLADLGMTTSTIAHEVNQPLTAIVGFASACQRMLEAGNSDEETLRDALAQIAQQGTRASDVISRIRHLAKKRKVRSEAVNLNATIQGVLVLLDDELRRSDVTVSLDLEQTLPHVISDAVHTEQIVFNLVRNAVEAMRVEGIDRCALYISTRRDGDKIILDVRDTGPGLSVGDEDKVFQSFYTTKQHGLGVGLSICRDLANIHGGALWADPTDSEGKQSGACFHLSLCAQPSE